MVALIRQIEINASVQSGGREERMSGELARGTQEMMREAVKGDFMLHTHQESLKKQNET